MLPAEYSAQLAAALDANLRHSLRDYEPVELDVVVARDHQSLTVRAVRGSEGSREQTFTTDQEVYHYAPNGEDPETHAGWLSEWFQEEHTDFVHRGYHGPRHRNVLRGLPRPDDPA